MAVPSTFTGAAYQPALQTGILQCRLKERCRSRNALKSTARLRRTPLLTTRSEACEHDWVRAATLPVVPLSVFGVCLESPHVQAHDRGCCAHDLMLATVSIDGGCRWQAAAHNSSVAWSADYLAAWFGPRSKWLQLPICFVMRRRSDCGRSGPAAPLRGRVESASA